MRRLSLIAILLFPLSVSAQVADLAAADLWLHTFFRDSCNADLRNPNWEEESRECWDHFQSMFLAVLRTEGSMQYPFPEVLKKADPSSFEGNVEIIMAPDSNLRIYSWRIVRESPSIFQVRVPDGTVHTFPSSRQFLPEDLTGMIQYKSLDTMQTDSGTRYIATGFCKMGGQSFCGIIQMFEIRNNYLAAIPAFVYKNETRSIFFSIYEPITYDRERRSFRFLDHNPDYELEVNDQKYIKLRMRWKDGMFRLEKKED